MCGIILAQLLLLVGMVLLTLVLCLQFRNIGHMPELLLSVLSVLWLFLQAELKLEELLSCLGFQENEKVQTIKLSIK
ncbi:hypothetical protein GPAdV-5_gp01 [unidentified adenovirus]|nr:hypothetical protein GPAdV-4_gp01 [unidentified adenovirus]ALB78202.1 hypothetical protein GPAdV-5_gp01 [unidentified adenovirus]